MTPLAKVRLIEDALLLDPCVDEPEEHLIFRPDGFIQAVTERGETTVKVCNLNRERLVEERQNTYQLTQIEYRQALLNLVDGSDELAVVRSHLTDPHRPHLAAVRAAIRDVERWVNQSASPAVEPATVTKVEAPRSADRSSPRTKRASA
jgi:hypothetical protein